MNEKLSFMNEYETIDGADKYIIGAVRDGKAYAIISNKIPSEWVKVEKASRNQGNALRLRIPASAKYSIKSNGFYVCEESELIDTVGHYNKKNKLKFWNKGEMFEKVITERFFNETWSKDTIRLDKCGDARMNGIEYQIKFQDATLTNEKILANIK